MIEYPQTEAKPLFSTYLCSVSTWEELKSLAFPSDFFVLLLLADFSSTTQGVVIEVASDLIAKGLRYICCWGKDCVHGELYFDLANIERQNLDESEPSIMSTYHREKDFDEALWFALYCASPDDKLWDRCTTVVVNLGKIASHAKLDEYLRNLKAFNDRIVT
jgi:hypothetical protein